MADSPKPRTRSEVCADLEALSHEPGYPYSLAFILRHDLFLDPAEALEVNWRERLSYQELSFIAGLMIKRPVGLTYPVDEKAVARQVHATYSLFEELHATYTTAWVEKFEEALAEGLPQTEAEFRQRTQEFFGAGALMSEPIFYSSSGAYDFQYWDLAPRRYELDAAWLAQNAGLDVARAAATVRALKDRKVLPPPSDPATMSFHDVCEAVLNVFCVTDGDIRETAGDESEAFLEAFSLEPGSVNDSLREPGDYNTIESHPIVRLDEGRYFIPVHFNLARSLYESPLYWMLRDTAYADTAAEHRGTSTELIAAQMLATVFGEDRVHRGVVLRRGRHVVGEIDILAVLGTKALIVQCKSKKLTVLARRGDPEQLKADFRDAIQSAYE